MYTLELFSSKKKELSLCIGLSNMLITYDVIETTTKIPADTRFFYKNIFYYKNITRYQILRERIFFLFLI